MHTHTNKHHAHRTTNTQKTIFLITGLLTVAPEHQPGIVVMAQRVAQARKAYAAEGRNKARRYRETRAGAALNEPLGVWNKPPVSDAALGVKKARQLASEGCRYHYSLMKVGFPVMSAKQLDDTLKKG